MFPESSVLDWIFKGLFAVLGWVGITLHNRVSALEKDKASREELKSGFTDLKETMKEHRAETQQNFKEIRSLLMGKPPSDE